MPQTDWEWQTKEGAFDKDSFKRCGTTEWLEHRLPHQQPNPQDSPGSNRKHLFRSDNSIGCLWGATRRDIKRIRKEAEEGNGGQSSNIDRQRKGRPESERHGDEGRQRRSPTKKHAEDAERLWGSDCSFVIVHLEAVAPVPQWLHNVKRSKRVDEGISVPAQQTETCSERGRLMGWEYKQI